MASDRDEQLRVEAAGWFARMRSEPDDATHQEFDAWLVSDAEHIETYQRLLQTYERTAFAGRSGVGRGRDLGRIAASRHRHRRLAVAAAVPLLVAIGAIGIGVDLRHRSTGEQGEVAGKEAATGRSLSLPDGSRVVLSDGAVFRFAYLSVERRVFLDQGSARFIVASEPQRPFIVEAGGGKIIAHGKIFDVAVKKDGVRVAPIAGDVEVVKPVGGLLSPSMLREGQFLSFAKADPSAAATPPPAPLHAATLTFDDTRLADAIALFNRGHDQPLKLSSIDLEDLRISGVYRTADPTGFADAVAQALHLAVKSNGGVIEIGKSSLH